MFKKKRKEKEEPKFEEPEFPVGEIVLTRGEGKLGESKLGGCPYLRTKEDYPMGENGKPMLFLAQLNLKDIKNIPVLPDHGLLQFFVEWSGDDDYGAYAAPLVRYLENVSEAGAGLVTEHPYADEAYLSALPFEYPGRISFRETEMSDEVIESCRVGGYPYFPQDGDLDPESEFLLLQLADDAECRMFFGDCGSARFIIDLERLEELDFSDVSYSWDCC